MKNNSSVSFRMINREQQVVLGYVMMKEKIKAPKQFA